MLRLIKNILLRCWDNADQAAPMRQEAADGVVRWYLKNRLHREDGPAVEYPNGNKFWYVQGKLHRTDGPAVQYNNGDEYWFYKGQLHRPGDFPAVTLANGQKFWMKNGKRHREEDPAITGPEGAKKYFIDDKEVPATPPLLSKTAPRDHLPTNANGDNE